MPMPPFWRMARRFGFGPGGPGGPWGDRGPRAFARGDLKYALLNSLQERPKHGYEMIKELEERTGGFYTPSAGAIYPTLQLLEDRGWVTSETQDGKRVYTITDDGRAALKENEEQRPPMHGPGPWGHHGHRRGAFFEGRAELHTLRHSSMEVARLMRAAVLATEGNPERLAKLQAIVDRTRNDLNEFLGQSPTGGNPSGEPVEHV
jgi:DNA-binding PadR family transcriptional regulator